MADTQKTVKTVREQKKEPKKEPKKEKKNGFFKRLRKYFKDTWGEFKKIVWPSRKQVLNNCAVVLVTILVVAVVVFGLDTLFGWVRSIIIGAFSG